MLSDSAKKRFLPAQENQFPLIFFLGIFLTNSTRAETLENRLYVVLWRHLGVPYFPATKGGGPPPPFWNLDQVKSYLLTLFHFLGTPFFGSYRSAHREHFFAFQKMLNHCTKWWKGVPRGAKKRDQTQKSLGNVRVFLIKSHQQVPWPRQYGHEISLVWFAWLKSQSLWRSGITALSWRYSKHVSFCMSQVDSICSQAPS